MIAAQIVGTGVLTPIVPGSKADLHAQPGETRVWSAETGAAGQGEKGKAVLKVRLLSGSPEGVETVLVIGESPMYAQLLGVKKSWLGGVAMELYFDQVFLGGFAQEMEYLLERGTLLLGFTEAERASFQTLEGQRALYARLAALLLPSRKAELLRLAKPFYRLRIAEHPVDATTASHLTGPAKWPQGHPLPLNPSGAPLLHLATLCTQDIPPIADGLDTSRWGAYLSFFLDIQDTQKGWPQELGRFKVWSYAEPQTASQDSAPDPAYALVFEPGLDLPSYDHSALYALQLTDEELARYEMLYSTFKSAVWPQWEFEHWNKFLGYPQNVQGCVAYEAERLKEGLDYTEDIYRAAVAWELLLQVSPYSREFNFTKTFGHGEIYFMIRRKDLEAGNFQEAQLVVQST